MSIKFKPLTKPCIYTICAACKLSFNAALDYAPLPSTFPFPSFSITFTISSGLLLAILLSLQKHLSIFLEK